MMSTSPYEIRPAAADKDVWWVVHGDDIVAVALSEQQARRLCEERNGYPCRCIDAAGNPVDIETDKKEDG